MSAKPLKKCPECGKSALERLIGLGAGIIFKGGGFYETDYRSDSYKKAAEADGKASSGHVHTDSCACGQKTKTECAAGSSGESGANATKPADKPKSSAGTAASKPARSPAKKSKRT